MARKTPQKSPQNFESSLIELEQLVEAMEAGELSLDDALKHFEKGIALATSCQTALQHAEQKVTQLLEDGRRVAHPCDGGDVDAVTPPH